MTAEEMFKSLGYEKIKSEVTITYRKCVTEDITEEIAIIPLNRSFVFETYDKSEYYSTILSNDVLSAINEQIKELKSDGKW